MPKKFFIFFILLTLLATGGFSGASVYNRAHAQSVDELQANVNDLSAKIKALDAEIASYNAKILSTQGEAKTLKQALANLEAQRLGLTKQITSTMLKIQAAQKKIVLTQGEIVVTENTIDKNKDALVELLQEVYLKENAIPPFFATLTHSGSLSEALDSLKRDSDVSSSITGKVKDLREAKLNLQVTKSAYEENKKKLETLTARLADQKAVVEQTTLDKAKLLTQTKDKESQYQQLLVERKAKKDQLEAELLDVESKLKVFVDASKLPRTGKGVLKYPLASVKITQYFGNTPFSSANPQVYNGSGHNGVDFGTPIGTPILAAQSGIVLGTGNTDSQCSGVSYGKWILIKHSNGLTTLYAHLSRISVTAGQTVGAQEQIALSGNTGYSTGPHLHFTVYASDSVHISGATEYRSKICGTYMIMPLAPKAGYLNPLSYL